jgi:hypothetical protein
LAPGGMVEISHVTQMNTPADDLVADLYVAIS